MGNKAIDEAKERVKSAINNSLQYPSKRITINLAPARTTEKDGTHHDLPITLTILINSGRIRQNAVEDSVSAGELALNGDLRPIRGAIIVAETARNVGVKRLFLPIANTAQAHLVPDIEIIGIKSLKNLYLRLKNEVRISIQSIVYKKATDNPSPTIDDVYGQEQAKRALVIAAAGHHNFCPQARQEPAKPC